MDGPRILKFLLDQNKGKKYRIPNLLLDHNKGKKDLVLGPEPSYKEY